MIREHVAEVDLLERLDSGAAVPDATASTPSDVLSSIESTT